jgi:hypothetical protein
MFSRLDPGFLLRNAVFLTSQSPNRVRAMRHPGARSQLVFRNDGARPLTAPHPLDPLCGERFRWSCGLQDGRSWRLHFSGEEVPLLQRQARVYQAGQYAACLHPRSIDDRGRAEAFVDPYNLACHVSVTGRIEAGTLGPLRRRGIRAHRQMRRTRVTQEDPRKRCEASGKVARAEGRIKGQALGKRCPTLPRIPATCEAAGKSGRRCVISTF